MPESRNVSPVTFFSDKPFTFDKTRTPKDMRVTISDAEGEAVEPDAVEAVVTEAEKPKGKKAAPTEVLELK